MSILESREIHLRERTNSSGEYEVYTTGIPHGLKYTVKKEGNLYIIFNQFGDAREKKDNEGEARAFTYKRALGFLEMFEKNYKGEEKPKIIDEIQLKKDNDAQKDPQGLVGILKDGFSNMGGI